MLWIVYHEIENIVIYERNNAWYDFTTENEYCQVTCSSSYS